MRVVIPGGSGHLGTLLARSFHEAGQEVIVLSRTPRPAPWWSVQWDGKLPGPWAAQLEGADVVINLAGRNVDCRYHAANRKAIMDSRVDSTRVVGEAIRHCARPPRVWLQASTATIYAHRYDAPNDEAHGILGGHEPDAPETWRFSIDVAQAWERALDEADTPSTRKVKMRSAIVMSTADRAPFAILRNLARIGLGGKQGDGRQLVSWIHERDFIRAVHWLIAHEELDGAINVAAPNPLPNDAFMRAIRDAAGAPFAFPLREWMLHIGSILMRTETELLLKSRYVVPSRLLASGFTFDYPSWPEAARELCVRGAQPLSFASTW